MQHQTPVHSFVRAKNRSAVDRRDMRTALALTAHDLPKGCDPAHAERAQSALAANCWDVRIKRAHAERLSATALMNKLNLTLDEAKHLRVKIKIATYEQRCVGR